MAGGGESNHTRQSVSTRSTSRSGPRSARCRRTGCPTGPTALVKCRAIGSWSSGSNETAQAPAEHGGVKAAVRLTQTRTRGGSKETEERGRRHGVCALAGACETTVTAGEVPMAWRRASAEAGSRWRPPQWSRGRTAGHRWHRTLIPDLGADRRRGRRPSRRGPGTAAGREPVVLVRPHVITQDRSGREERPSAVIWVAWARIAVQLLPTYGAPSIAAVRCPRRRRPSAAVRPRGRSPSRSRCPRRPAAPGCPSLIRLRLMVFHSTRSTARPDRGRAGSSARRRAGSRTSRPDAPGCGRGGRSRLSRCR